MDPLVSATKAAEIMGVAKSTLYAMVKQRRITCYKIGDRVQFDIEKLRDELMVPALERPKE